MFINKCRIITEEKTKNVEKYLADLTLLFADRYKTDFVVYEGNNAFEDIKKVINNKIDEIANMKYKSLQASR